MTNEEKGKEAGMLQRLKSAKLTNKRILLGCYALALALWLGCGLGFYLYDSRLPTLVLDINDADFQELRAEGGYRYVAEGYDPQVLFDGVNTKIRRVVLHAEFDSHPGEMDLYYTRREGQGYSASRRVFGYLQADGTYAYTLPAGRVVNLRLDPGSRPGGMALVGIEVNPAQPLAAYFTPSLASALLLLIAPALAACAVCTIMELIQWLVSLRKKDGHTQ